MNHSVIRHLDAVLSTCPTCGRLVEALTKREMDVIVELAKGQTNQEIGLALNMSFFTVKNHITDILRKTDASDRLTLLLRALVDGWIELVPHTTAPMIALLEADGAEDDLVGAFG